MQNETAESKNNQAKLTGKFFEAYIPHQFKYQVLNMTGFYAVHREPRKLIFFFFLSTECKP